MKILTLLPWADWLAMALFFGLWLGYAWFAKVNGRRNMTLIATTNHYRQLWMLQATARDPRMLDGLITQNLSHTPSFFHPRLSSSLVDFLLCWVPPTKRLNWSEKFHLPNKPPCWCLSSRSWFWWVFLSTPSFASLGRCGSTLLSHWSLVPCLFPKNLQKAGKTALNLQSVPATWSVRRLKLSTMVCAPIIFRSRPWLGFFAHRLGACDGAGGADFVWA